MKLSIIIPTLNEESLIEKNLSFIKKELSAISYQLSVEIIVADGGSRDKTVEIARRFADRVCISDKGRGKQMNAGARISAGDWLLFLHADSVISEQGIRGMLEIINSEFSIIGGAFRLKIDSKKTFYKILSSFANMRSRILGIAYGDQGIFVRKNIFYMIGGYPDIPIMEDVEFVKRLKENGKFIILNECVTTSSRRWDREGILYTTIRNWILISLYLIGVSPNRLKGWYREHGG
ncbi:MAG: TIGR04283 family arsenosugar biosynthesis glycosyltransferase [Nitrospinae bacterium]|nr:TIGR04283 family arsenosugar biosynthesis glycosyltransferase [Nitrospinota bacterium]